jgi:hypothetical protein
MNLSLAIVTAVAADGCHVETLDGRPLVAGTAHLARNRVRVVASQLVALDSGPQGAEVVWRWFRGPVLMIVDGYAVVDYRPYQPGFRFPIGVAAIPEHLRDVVTVGAEVFFTTHEAGAIAAVVREGGLVGVEQIAAELYPAIEQVFAERGA